MNRKHAVSLVQKLLDGGGETEAEDSRIMAELKKLLPHPGISNLIFYPKRPMTAEEIVDEALAYKPIILGPGDGKK